MSSQTQTYKQGTGIYPIEDGSSVDTSVCVVNKDVHTEKMRRRLSAAYHIERSIAHRMGLPEYPCACNRCRGAIIKKVETVARHHSIHGRDPYLVYPVMVGKTLDLSCIVASRVKLLCGSAK